MLMLVVAVYGSNCTLPLYNCGDACYNPSEYYCSEYANVLYLCPLRWEVCNSQCYNTSLYDCVNVYYQNPNVVNYGALIFDLTSLYTNQTLLNVNLYNDNNFVVSFPDGFNCGGDPNAITCQVYYGAHSGLQIPTADNTTLIVSIADSTSVTLRATGSSENCGFARLTYYNVVCANSTTPTWIFDGEGPTCYYNFTVLSTAGCPQHINNVGKLLCPKGDVACGQGCLNPNTYHCVDYQNGIFCLNGYDWCVGVDACYDPNEYSCQDGQLVQNSI